jgi:hypothetical protein
MSEYFQYISVSDYNFNISLLNKPDAVSLFDNMDQHIKHLHSHLNALPKLTSQDATYIIGIFMLISLRQMRNAFFLFLRRMSYDGMLLFRVGLESAVFAYRIFKNNELAKVWALKEENWKNFSEEFRRKQFPADIPFRDEIKDQLDLLNNYWSHPNINYFSTSTVFSDKEQQSNNREIKLHFFDHKEDDFQLNLFWFFDCSIKIIAIYRKIFKEKFPILITSTEEKYQKILINFEELKKKYKP